MSLMDPDIQWYLARDGKQFGPLSSAELKKLLELGHLKPADLLWRQGFADWRPATAVFQLEQPRQPQSPAQPQQPAYQPQPQMRAGPQPGEFRPQGNAALASSFGTPVSAGAVQPAYGRGSELVTEPQPRTGRRVLVASLFMLSLIGAAAWLGFQNREAINGFISSLSKPPSAKSPSSQSAPAADAKAKQVAASPEATPAASSAAPTGDEAAMDQRLEGVSPWPVLKKEFPEFYAAKVGALSKLAAEGKTDADISAKMVEALVEFRRQNTDKALAASTESLKGVAQAFVANLKHLTGEGPEVCHGFISKGEASPGVIALYQKPEKNAPITAQFDAIVKAITEGKTNPVSHPAPTRPDYTVLTGKLNELGWTQGDIQLFANPAELAKAPQERVCKMVQDWFTAHLAIEDAAVQERLLVETLRPVIGG